MLYSLEYFFIPSVVEKSNEDELDINGVIQFDAFDSFQIAFAQDFPEQAIQFNWDDFSITKKMTANCEYWFFDFPYPISEPEALWGIVIHQKDQPYKYYTFERTHNENFVLGGMTQGMHANYGIYDAQTSKEEFIQMAMALAEGHLSLFE